MRLTAKQIDHRANALEDAAVHLDACADDMDLDEDREEKEQYRAAAKTFRVWAEAWTRKRIKY